MHALAHAIVSFSPSGIATPSPPADKSEPSAPAERQRDTGSTEQQPDMKMIAGPTPYERAGAGVVRPRALHGAGNPYG